MRVFGLIGYPLAHSFSEKYFTDKFNREQIINCVYKNFELTNIHQLKNIISNNPDLSGLNVTLPYKTAVIPFLNEISPEAQKIGAVNTIKIETIGDKKILKGFNTDVFGFEQSLLPLLKPFHQNAIILGAGGAALAVAFVLSKLQINYLVVVRNKPSANETIFPNTMLFDELSENLLQQQQLIINTTPLGTYPNIDSFPPLPYTAIANGAIAFDLVYNPDETLFLSKAKEQGAVIKSGSEMLQLQAEKAWQIWNQND